MRILYCCLTTIICLSSVVLFAWCKRVNIYHDYCIVGAGPSGLQLGYFFKRAGRDYVIFEKSNISGSFFRQYPRHRTLISLNKRHTGKTNKEFNLRHDWNSLLSDDESLKFTKYSKELFPDADRYLEYLKDYKHKLDINVQFNTEISNIKWNPIANGDGLYVFTTNDQRGLNYTCGRLIIATGVAKPVIPDIPGIEYTEGYETMSLNRSQFEGLTVLILGRGNSAFETATHIYGSTNAVHMTGRPRVRLSWATHYVGDLRAVNNQLLDTYQLKSLDGVLEISANEISIVKTNGKLHARVNREETDEMVEPVRVFNFRQPYDKIIRCLGFAFDVEMFDRDMKLTHPKGRKRKYISIHPNYESVDYPGMYVAGTASHSLDFRQSAGGFIHGYRYTARALFRLLEWKYHNVPWPSVTLSVGQLVNHIMRRINEGSGIYQMFSVLGDIVIVHDDETFTYLEEVPIHLIDKLPKMTGHEASNIIVVNLQYGPDFSGPGNDVFRPDRATGEASKAHKSNFLHPCLYYYDSLPSEKEMRRKERKAHLPRPKLLHHIVESFYTVWDSPIDVLHLRRFIENILNEDMRDRFTESCLEHALTSIRLPYHCRETYMKGEGLSKL